MIKMKKLPLFVLVLAVMFSTGGSCIFPMFTAQAFSGAMQMDTNDENKNIVNVHEADPMAHSPLSGAHVSTCSTNCGQNNTDVVAIKNTKNTLEFPSLVSQDTYGFPLLIGLDLSVLESLVSPSLLDTLLSVAKKE